MWLKNTIESYFMISLIVNAILFIPQIVRLLKIKDSKELSFITFFGFNLIQIAVILHGYIKKDYLLLFGNLLSLITCGLVTILIVYYRIKSK